MRDKVIIVTGGSSGMGKAMATKFAEEGANVVITGRSLERLEAAKAEMEKFEGQVLCIDMDVRDPERVQYTVDKTIETYGKIDGLVNNAAGNFLCPAEDLSLNGWNSVIDIVLNGTWYCTQAVGKEWIKNGQQGRIINMVATYAWRAGIGVVHSASAKAGVLSMTRTLAVEWGSKYGITVNAIAPGPIDNTGGSGKLSLSEEAKQQTLDSVPLGRMGQPEEIASLAKFLLSEEASYINGACMTMDGGQWLNQNPF
ncbi:2,4-dienoyl-CoA reductase [Staphylococcus xylosus]|mgnify:FL=1|uniref:Diacetyl reductase [(S)-acetoin forming] n=1 Tax=Staphylococcus xylosus TaxID=1288 RepID=A0A5R9B1J9_STAXY|nr:2,4-dienoyl-CoA reductase [Staphylococcus xylosus]MBM6639262.1 2,4-dienoyl-CoA reductase [Staphylococcus xylosus]MDW8554976.1 2,4-dienoyl-CoA reductase [Staphylococcus xylosus]MEB7756351.1 2,4-dienoyl-CoA reductase [Staphylococcus xylosus]MEB7798957.1 2,4-dienoyl-CoA reductase [Staphylococcus xylosus]MEB8148347.1 2,4-dienoyl-CoA reductase [Staphylococcus xylosus]